MPRAILLDFYGTVVEEDDALIGAICEEIRAASPVSSSAAEIGSYWSRVFHQMCVHSFGPAFQSQTDLENRSLTTVLHRFRADLDPAVFTRALRDQWAHPALFPESRETLARCGIPICLVTNIDNSELRSALRHSGLCFDWVVTSEDCRAYKPRREMFQRALALLELTANDVVHVGDSFTSDVRGARALEIRTLWVNRKDRPVPCGEPRPDFVSADLRGLLDLRL